jgi:8-oxo-dGTP pyrophosphatase MutT (NUDIX family)
MWNDPTVRIFTATRAIIPNKEGKILVIRQVIAGKEFYDVPGGKCVSGETLEDCVVREVLEEVGLVVKDTKKVGEWWFMRIKDGDKVMCHTFTCKTEDTLVNTQKNTSFAEKDENKEFLWLTLEEFGQDKYHLNRENKGFQDIIRSLI